MKKTSYVLLFILLFCNHFAIAQYYVNAIAGYDTCAYLGDGGPALLAALKYPQGICRDKAGNLYVVDDYSYIRTIRAATGIITTIAGGGAYTTASDDNIPATSAFLDDAVGICLDTAGNLLIADGWSRIRKVNMVTGIITTVAGTLTKGYSGDTGPATAAELYFPRDVKIDTANNIYIADVGNELIRRVDAVTGIITTIAGSSYCTFGGDGGPAIDAQICLQGLFVDKHANIYIADFGNFRVRKITAATGIITTVAGTGVNGFSGDGMPATAAEISHIFRVTLDDTGNIYIADRESETSRIRKITAATGIITTIAGNGGTVAIAGDTIGNGGPATAAQMGPWDLCIDTCGNIFFTDYACAVRVLTPTALSYREDCNRGVLASPRPSPQVERVVSVWPNPVTDELNITGVQQNRSYRLYSVTGIGMQQGMLHKGSNTLSMRYIIPGVYILEMTGEDGVRNMVRVVKE